MEIYDQHVHTAFSHDSKEEYENYLKVAVEKGKDFFVATEHLDLSCVGMGRDVIPDFGAEWALATELSKKYPIRTLRGVEIGFKPSIKDRLQPLLAGEGLDVILLGIHESEELPLTKKEFLTSGTNDEVYRAYLGYYLEAVESYHDYDILVHLDYVLRYLDGEIELSLHTHELEKIFRVIVPQKKSLELNTRLLYRYGDKTHYIRWILETYKACGGEKVSLGSDAHRVGDYLGGFDEGISLLKEYGFGHVSLFQGRKEVLVEL